MQDLFKVVPELIKGFNTGAKSTIGRFDIRNTSSNLMTDGNYTYELSITGICESI